MDLPWILIVILLGLEIISCFLILSWGWGILPQRYHTRILAKLDFSTHNSVYNGLLMLLVIQLLDELGEVILVRRLNNRVRLCVTALALLLLVVLRHSEWLKIWSFRRERNSSLSNVLRRLSQFRFTNKSSQYNTLRRRLTSSFECVSEYFKRVGRYYYTSARTQRSVV